LQLLRAACCVPLYVGIRSVSVPLGNDSAKELRKV
jgi:hypothetical protein